MGKAVIKCSLCEHCKGNKRNMNTRMEYWCKRADTEHISNYYKEHKITKAIGFIGFGKPYSRELPIKSSPAWCPRKKEG